jgi:hypothetical protein
MDTLRGSPSHSRRKSPQWQVAIRFTTMSLPTNVRVCKQRSPTVHPVEPEIANVSSSGGTGEQRDEVNLRQQRPSRRRGCKLTFEPELYHRSAHDRGEAGRQVVSDIAIEPITAAVFVFSYGGTATA